ncbi:MAG: Uma2 family endonuclease, partial [Gemmatimonadaceae bacterium]|nr:Uma2 family endonuclease [Gemmatimonadaceae bacterium]
NSPVTHRTCLAPIVRHAELHFPPRRAYGMGMPATTDRYWTPADLAQFPERDGNRYECIGGELFVTPSPRPVHVIAQELLRDELHQALRAAGESLRVFDATQDFLPTAKDLVQPDLFVLRERATASMRLDKTGCVVLIVEVLSPSTAARDRGIKRLLYQRAGVPEYWVVDVDARRIERWTPDASTAEICHDVIEWRDPVSEAVVRIDLPRFFAEVLDEGPPSAAR